MSTDNQPLPADRTTSTDADEAADRAKSLVRLLQFGDSMFPIGGFSFSLGLESAVQKGIVTGVTTLHEFTRTAVEQAARGDGIALIAAHRAAIASDVSELMRIDEMVYVRKLSQEIRSMSVRMGKKFTEMGVHVLGAPLLHTWQDCIRKTLTPGCYPVALAINFAVQNLPAQHAFAAHQYGVAVPILGAAMRLMKVSHVDTQKILYDLSGQLNASYKRAAEGRMSDMSGYAPLTDILAAVHTKAHVRLFMN